MADLTRKIMRRVYFIWFMRHIWNPVTVKVVLMLLFVSQIVSFVSVKDIIANWHVSDWGISGNYAFMQSAVLQTDFAVQMLILGVLFILALLARDVLVRSGIIHSQIFARI